MTLKQIAQAVGGTVIPPEADGVVDYVSTDTRTIGQGSLFIAIQGERFDGHNFVPQAMESGAVAALVSKKPESSDPVILVEDTRKAYGDLAAWYRNQFSLFLVGVTGSVGKTSTKEMIYTVLSHKMKVLKTQGNLNNDIGLPKTLLELDDSHQGAVIEMGMSHFGEISYLSRICRPTLGVITNIGVSHMENLGSRENILKAKLEILDGMEPDGTLILNRDNDMLSTLYGKRENTLWFGIDAPADVTAKDIVSQGSETQFTLCFQGKEYPAVIPVIGVHNVYNALAGFLVGIQVGMAPEEIIESFLVYQNSGMRQKISEYDGIKVIEDCYNASPDSMRSALNVIETIPCDGRRIAVLGDMLELGENSVRFHEEVGEMAAESGLDELICFGTEALHIQKGAKEKGFCQVSHFLDKGNMVSYLRKILKKGDAVIFKASRGIRLEEVTQALFKGEK
ncbi:MAG: UDP-N-acetylmuramoyl-tripeptide--D-alanyl-D-alanine ligase [Massiliimalia sp.]